jgi:hypothetical protein
MMDEELQNRVRRIYAAIGDAEEIDLSQFQPEIGISDNCVSVYQDFRGGLSDEQISNIAHSAIHNLANLRDHLRRWARRSGYNPDRINQAVDKSFELQVLIDLSNVDKHGYESHDTNHSGRAPKLSEVNRVMMLSTGSQPNSSAVLTLTPKPVARFMGTGSAKVVVTGTIVDKTGLLIGDLHSFLEKGTEVWEGLLAELGVKMADSILRQHYGRRRKKRAAANQKDKWERK